LASRRTHCKSFANPVIVFRDNTQPCQNDKRTGKRPILPACGRDASPRRPQNIAAGRQLQPSSITQPNSHCLRNLGRAVVLRRPDYSNNLPKWLPAADLFDGEPHRSSIPQPTVANHDPSRSFLEPQRGSITQPRVARNELPWVPQPHPINSEGVESVPIKVQIKATKPPRFSPNLSVRDSQSKYCNYSDAQIVTFWSSLIKPNQGSFVPFVNLVTSVLNTLFLGQINLDQAKAVKQVNFSSNLSVSVLQSEFCIYSLPHITVFQSSSIKVNQVSSSLCYLSCLLLNPFPIHASDARHSKFGQSGSIKPNQGSFVTFVLKILFSGQTKLRFLLLNPSPA
jgi:hypothetical protein